MRLIRMGFEIVGAATICLIIVACSALLIHLEGRRDDMSLRYILWKKGLYSYPHDHIAGAMFADNQGRKLLAGKTKSEVMKLFPNTYSDARTDCQNYYEKELIREEYLWFDDDCLYISFKDGKAEFVNVMKG